MIKIAANVVSVQLAWVACAYGAVVGMPSLGILGCMLAIGLSLALFDERKVQIYLAAILGAYGFVVEGVMVISGGLQYASPGPWPTLAPLWIVTLWMAFSVMIYPTFGWFIGQPTAASLLGATMAPLSYLAADRVGALQIAEPVHLPLLGIALIWAIALPVAIHARTLMTSPKVLPKEISR